MISVDPIRAGETPHPCASCGTNATVRITAEDPEARRQKLADAYKGTADELVAALAKDGGTITHLCNRCGGNIAQGLLYIVGRSPPADLVKPKRGRKMPR